MRESSIRRCAVCSGPVMVLDLTADVKPIWSCLWCGRPPEPADPQATPQKYGARLHQSAPRHEREAAADLARQGAPE
jgi:hypothetical protein